MQLCGLNDRIFWEQPYGAAYPSTFCMPYAAVKDDLVCKKVEEVSQKIFAQTPLTPAGTLLTYIGVGVILSAALFVGMRIFLESAIPDDVFNRKKGV